MNRPPAFQFYANDWLSSTKISIMTPAEEGAYIRLLCHAWNDPHCCLPDDDEQLAVLSRLFEEWYKGSSEKIRNCFLPDTARPGKIFNKRLRDERKKQNEWRRKCRKGGLSSGKKRKNSSNFNAKGSSSLLPSKFELNSNSSVFSLQSSSSIKEKINTLSGKAKILPDDALRKGREENRILSQEAIEILNFLNLKANKRFPPNETNLGFIRARLKEGADRQTCFSVIAMKCREWLQDPDTRKWLRPATLFNRTKFNTYVGELGPIEQEEQSDAMPGMSEEITTE